MERMPYTLNEDISILKYLINKKAFELVNGNTIYKQMIIDGVCQNRSFHSIRNRFLRYIKPRMHTEFNRMLSGVELPEFLRPKYRQLLPKTVQKVKPLFSVPPHLRDAPSTSKDSRPLVHKEASSDDSGRQECRVLPRQEPAKQVLSHPQIPSSQLTRFLNEVNSEETPESQDSYVYPSQQVAVSQPVEESNKENLSSSPRLVSCLYTENRIAKIPYYTSGESRREVCNKPKADSPLLSLRVHVERLSQEQISKHKTLAQIAAPLKRSNELATQMHNNELGNSSSKEQVEEPTSQVRVTIEKPAAAQESIEEAGERRKSRLKKDGLSLKIKRKRLNRAMKWYQIVNTVKKYLRRYQSVQVLESKAVVTKLIEIVTKFAAEPSKKKRRDSFEAFRVHVMGQIRNEASSGIHKLTI